MDAWIAEKIGLSTLDTDGLRLWQMRRLAELIPRCRERSPFYRRHYAGIAELPDPLTPAFLAELPFVDVRHLREENLDFLCLSQDEIARVVSLSTSGTTGAPKRVFFTADDIAATLDFFKVGMSTIVGPGDCVLITVPGRTTDGAAQLLKLALPGIGVRAELSYEPFDPEQVAGLIGMHKPSCLLALPSQLCELLLHDAAAQAMQGQVKRVMLTGELVTGELRLKGADLGMELFDHYGLTETCLGGGVECLAHDGYHLREADLYVEIVDPQSGRPVPVGQPGEVVVSTISRLGMPLLRYRTGDYARLVPGPCRCGSPLARLSQLAGRIHREQGGFTVVSPRKAGRVHDV